MGTFWANFIRNRSILRWFDVWLMFFNRNNNFAILTTKCLRNEPMAKILTSRLAPSFSQHNLHLVVLGCSLIVMMKFQDRFASLRQLNSPNSCDKFQICCIDFYLIRFLVNFAGLPEFRISTTLLHTRSPDTVSCVIYIIRPSDITQWCDFAQLTLNCIGSHNLRKIA